MYMKLHVVKLYGENVSGKACQHHAGYVKSVKLLNCSYLVRPHFYAHG